MINNTGLLIIEDIKHYIKLELMKALGSVYKMKNKYY